jgi:hypothetical protein
MRFEIYEALKLKYESEKQTARTNLRMYLKDAVAVADHPNLVETVDKLFENYMEAKEKLNTLEEDYDELVGNERLL